MTRLLVIIFGFIAFPIWSQITQTVKGSVVDSESQLPLIGARLTLVSDGSTNIINSSTDIDGFFNLKNVPIGKYSLTVGYNSYLNSTQTIIVNSGKESVVNIKLQEDIITTEEINIVGKKNGEVNNDMALISARQFSVEETEDR